jgi:hypothetical protein
LKRSDIPGHHRQEVTAQLTVEHSVHRKPVPRPYKGPLGTETAPPIAPNEFQALSDLEAVLASLEAQQEAEVCVEV